MNLHRFHPIVFLPVAMLLFAGISIVPPVAATIPIHNLIITQAQSRSRIAVLDFDLADTSGNYGSYSFFRGIGPARGISDLLTNKLVRSGNYSVIERSRLEDILREQNLVLSGRIDPSKAAEIGRILGVEYVVLGSITRFNLQENNTGGRVCLPFIGCVGGGMNTYTAKIELTARLVNTTTAEIVLAAEGQGTAKQQGGRVDTGDIDVDSSTQNHDELVSDAADEAIAQLVDELTDSTNSSVIIPSQAQRLILSTIPLTGS
jgi:curli biogenesis system outer membrane secretion channel CsgG